MALFLCAALNDSTERVLIHQLYRMMTAGKRKVGSRPSPEGGEELTCEGEGWRGGWDGPRPGEAAEQIKGTASLWGGGWTGGVASVPTSHATSLVQINRHGNDLEITRGTIGFRG